MTDINEVRRKNLRKLVNDYEGMNSLARRLGLTRGAFISQLLSTPPVRTMGEKTARKWEKALGLAEGWMDLPAGEARNVPMTETQVLIETIVKRVLEETKQRRLNLSPEQISNLVGMSYRDAEMSGGFDTGRMTKILDLIPR